MQVMNREIVEDSLQIREKVMAARLIAQTRWKYFSSQLLSMVLVAKPGSSFGTCATDCKGRFYYDPAFVQNVSVEELATIWLHECLHCWLDHANRRDGRDSSRWNKAVDREINDDLVGEGFPFPLNYPPLLPFDIGQENGQLAEFYYECEEEEDGEDEGEGDGKGKGGGSSMDGEPRDWEDGDETPSVPEAVQECIRHDVSNKIVEHSKTRGRVPGGLLQEAMRQIEPPKVSWQKELASAVRACAADVAGAVDFTYRRPSRRQSIYGDIIMPAVRRPVPETVIVLDTSGSMYGGDLDSALRETQGVLKSLGGRGIRVLSTDSQVHSRQRVSHTSKIKALGGGGTDMRVGIAEARKLKPSPDLCIVLTDGYTPWPDNAPKGMKVIVGVTGRHGRDGPSWARNIRIDAE